MNDIYPQLTEPFPREMEKILNKGGTALTYIPVSEVITRLNKVLGVDKWSFKIVRCERDASDPDFVVAHVRLEWTPTVGEDFNIVTRDGFGGQKINSREQYPMPSRKQRKHLALVFILRVARTLLRLSK